LRVLTHCTGITTLCDTGDDIECNFFTGRFINHTRKQTHDFPPVPEELRELIAEGGNKGWLAHWWQTVGASQQA